MKIFIAKETEYEMVQTFYHELISKIQKYPYHPTWIIGIYPDDDYLKQLTMNGQVFLGIDHNRVIAAMVLNNHPNDGYETVSWQVPASNADATILHLLGVLPEYWGNGLGGELLDFAEHLLKAKE